MPGTQCAVVTCHSSWRQLNKWKSKWCDLHSCNLGTCRCVCDPPFTLINFPTARKDNEARKRWIKAINRKNPKTGKNWEPGQYHRVCSEHFVDKIPTEKNPDPTLNLGYIPCRKPRPSRRKMIKHDLVRFRWKRCSKIASDPVIKTRTSCNDDQLMSVNIGENVDNEMCESDHTYSNRCECVKPSVLNVYHQMACPGCQEKQKTIDRLQAEVLLLRHKCQLQNYPRVTQTNSLQQSSNGLLQQAPKSLLHTTPKKLFYSSPKRVLHTLVPQSSLKLLSIGSLKQFPKSLMEPTEKSLLQPLPQNVDQMKPFQGSFYILNATKLDDVSNTTLSDKVLVSTCSNSELLQ